MIKSNRILANIEGHLNNKTTFFLTLQASSFVNFFISEQQTLAIKISRHFRLICLFSIFLISCVFLIPDKIRAQETPPPMPLPNIENPGVLQNFEDLYTTKSQSLFSLGGCTYTLSHPNYPATSTMFWWWQSPSGLATTITVNTQAGCPWILVNNNPNMLVIDSGGGSRVGTGTFTYRPLANTGTFRSGSITIAAGSLTVNNYQDSTTPACSQTPITFVSPQTGSTSTSDCTIYGIYTDEFTFSGTMNQQISITMTSSQITSYPRLTGTGNNSLNEIATGQNPNLSRIPTTGYFTLPETGNYKIRAGSNVFNTFVPNPNQPLGAYTVTLRDAASCTYSLSPNNFPVGGNGGSSNFTVNTPVGCAWSATTQFPWIHINSPIGTTSDTRTVSFSVDPNPGAFRSGTIIAGGQTFTINQGAAFTFSGRVTDAITSLGVAGVTINVVGITPIVPVTTDTNGNYTFIPLPNGTYTVSASQTGRTFTPSSQPVTINGSNVNNVNFVRNSLAPVITGLNPSQTTVGNTSITQLTIDGSNFLLGATVNFGGQIKTPSFISSTIIQIPMSPADFASGGTRNVQVINSDGVMSNVFPFQVNCIYSISPTSLTVSGASGSFGFNVITYPGCQWTATTQTPWISFNNNTGVNSGSVTFTVQQNGGAARNGTITVQGNTFTVFQNSLNNTTFSVSGKVRSTSGSGLQGVTIILDGPESRTAVTNSSGEYFIFNLPPAAYTLRPLLTGAAFDLTSRAFNIVSSNVTNQDFQQVNCTNALSGIGTTVSALGATVNPLIFGVPGGCGDWKAESNVPWIVINNEGMSNPERIVSYFVQQNYGVARSGNITVNGQIFTVHQQASSNIISGGQCNVVNINEQSRQIVTFEGTNSGTISVDVNTLNCDWTPHTPNAWIEINGAGATRTGDGQVNFIVKNIGSGNVARAGKITILGKEHKIVQTPRSIEGCDFQFNQPSADFSRDGGGGSFSITVNNNCQWKARSMDNWILTDNEGLNGNGVKSFTVNPNTGTNSRIGTIAVGNKVFTINQAGITSPTNCDFQLSSSSQNLTSGTGSGSLNVLTGTGCIWDATRGVNDTWLTIAGGSGNGNGTVSFTLDPNPLTTQRTGTISIGNQTQRRTFTVTQAGTQQVCSYTINPAFQNIQAAGEAGNITVTKANNTTCPNLITAVPGNDWITITQVLNQPSGDGSVNFVVQSNPSNQRTGIITIAGQIFNITQSAGVARINAANDFDGDGRTDISVFRPTGAVWHLLQSQSGYTGIAFGISTDKLVPADYDGDGKTDPAVYRDGIWYLLRSQSGFTGVQFGIAADIPQPADFDGDGKAELAVYRPANGVWYVYNLQTNQFTSVQFGTGADKPVVGDYDGDRKANYTVFRPSNGVWYIARPAVGQPQIFDSIQFGQNGDLPVQGDYDGDGKTDPAVFRNGFWHILGSATNYRGVQFGITNDKPVPGDYDGDGKTDIAVFRDGNWYLQRSTQGFTGIGFGLATDKPVPNAFVP